MTTIKPHPERDGDRHLRPAAYYALAVLAGAIGMSASYVTVQLFALAIQATEQEGTARDLLTLAAALFVAAELVAMFVAGLLPVRRLRALRWQLIAGAVLLVGFEAVSLYGARVVLIHATDAQASAAQGRAEALRSRIEASRRNAAALLAAGEFSSRSILPSSRAEGARSIREAAAMEADTARLAAELAQVEAARVPTASAVFGESGVIALAVAQSLLISGIGLLFLGAAGALARAARDARTALAPMHLTALADAPADALPAAAAAPVQQPMRVAVEQTQVTPRGAAAAVPNWHRYALPALSAGAGLLGASVTHAEPIQPPTVERCADAAPSQPVALATDTAEAPTIAAPATIAPVDALPTQAYALTDAPQAGTDAPTDALVTDTAALVAAPTDDAARFLRVKAGVEAGRIKPSLRAIYAAEGASQAVASRYLAELEQAGVIERAGRGYALRATTAKQEGEQA